MLQKATLKLPFFTHESASVVCVSGSSRRVERSMKSEWSFHTFPAPFQDSAVQLLGLGPSLVLLHTSHRLEVPLREERSPCGRWRTGRGIHSCHTEAGLCCQADHSLPQGNLQVTGALCWAALADSAELG